MKALSLFLVRVVFTALLALAVTPLANNLAGVVVDDYPEVSVPENVRTASDALLVRLSDQYGIEKPVLRFVDSKIPGSTTGKAGAAAMIRIGTPLQKAPYFEQQEWLNAVIAHEFGHAVIIARGQEFSLWLIIGIYGVGLFILLCVFPTIRGVVAGATVVTVLLGIMAAIPRWGNANSAFESFILLLPFGLIPLVVGKINLSIPLSLSRHLPSGRNLLLASLLAAPTYLLSAWYVGGLNSERELRADVFGACATSPLTMKTALSAIDDKPASAWSEAFDHFHPPASVRAKVLDAIQHDPLYRVACKNLHSNTRLDIAGLRIQ